MLPATEMSALGRKEERVSPKLEHPGLERYPGARGGLSEDHSQRLSQEGERLQHAFPLQLRGML